MRIKATWMTFVLALGIAGGCGDDGGVIMVPDGGPTPDSGPTGDSGPRVDGGPRTDGNDSFADAEELVLDGEPVAGTIATPGDLDYFTFEGTAGAWMLFATEANADDDPEMIDTVISLYDSSMTLIAENDDAPPRVNTDSELITRLPSTGTYYLLVQEWSTWAEEEPEGSSTFDYELTAFEINPEGGGNVNVDAEGGDDVATAQTLMYTAGAQADFAYVLGTFGDATDVDVYAFSAAAGRPNIEFQLMPGGSTGYGSTGQPARMWITNAAGDQIVARVEGDVSAPDGEVGLQPSLAEGDYLLWVEHPTTAGSNAFYVLKGFKLTDNPPEATEVANGLPATPEPIAFTADPEAPTLRRGFILARLGLADVDHYSVTTMAGEQINVFCGSRTAGSGIVGLTADVLTAEGLPLTPAATAMESATMALSLQNVAVPAAGTYLVRLTKTSQDAAVTGDWVRCGIALAPPAPTP